MILPIIFCTLIALAKSIYIGGFLGAAHDYSLYIYPFRNDLPLLGFIGFFSFAAALFSFSPLRVICAVISACGMTWYIFDTGAIFLLNARAPISEIVHYALEWRVYREIALYASIFLFFIALVLFSKLFRLNIKTGFAGLLLSFLLMFLPSEAPFHALAGYATPVFQSHPGRNLIAQSAPRFSTEELKLLDATEPISKNFIYDAQRRNIIMIVIESWSAADSFATSGLDNLTPGIDALASEGMIFRNFIANGGNTEEGLVSFLSGSAPLQFPGHSFSHYRSFADGDSSIAALKAYGYKTEFISSATLLFRNKKFFLDSLKFDQLLGMENVKEFQNGERFAFGAAPDAALYARAFKNLNLLNSNSDPFFMLIETTSSHLPYIDPLKQDNSEASIWKYVDAECVKFVDLLKQHRLLENSILIITSDHHKMIPLKSEEIAKYGSTANSRIPLFVIGKGIPAGLVDDRQFQQSDLLQKLPLIAPGSSPLSPIALHADSYSKPLFWGDNPADVTVIKAYDPRVEELRTWGTVINWLSTPTLAVRRETESIIKRLFSRRQYCLENTCNGKANSDIAH